MRLCVQSICCMMHLLIYHNICSMEGETYAGTDSDGESRAAKWTAFWHYPGSYRSNLLPDAGEYRLPDLPGDLPGAGWIRRLSCFCTHRQSKYGPGGWSACRPVQFHHWLTWPVDLHAA